MRRLFELDAETGDAELGLAPCGRGLEVTALDGTTMDWTATTSWPASSGPRQKAGRPLLRVVGHVRVASRRWIAAEVGALPPGRERAGRRARRASLRPGMVNLADRGFPSMERYIAVRPPPA